MMKSPLPTLSNNVFLFWKMLHKSTRNRNQINYVNVLALDDGTLEWQMLSFESSSLFACFDIQLLWLMHFFPNIFNISYVMPWH